MEKEEIVTISKEHVIHAMSPEKEPAAYVDSGATVCFLTYDCYQGQMLDQTATFETYDRSYANPATGPLYIHGAEPGDMLKIEIRKIILDEIGILDIGSNSGVLGQYFKDQGAVIRRLPVHNGQIRYSDELELSAQPMIGVIGTAPAEGEVSTESPKDHGGNMDCTRIREGSILYLPVFVEGGLLAMGDVHAIMGEGEVGNCGVEIGAEVTVRVSVEKQRRYRWPIIEDEEKWYTIAYGKTLDEAAEKASRQMFEFLSEECKLNIVDAGMLLDMAGDLIVCQIVNPYKTCRMEIPKKYVDGDR